jgi:hypothetical protein
MQRQVDVVRAIQGRQAMEIINKLLNSGDLEVVGARVTQPGQ